MQNALIAHILRIYTRNRYNILQYIYIYIPFQWINEMFAFVICVGRTMRYTVNCFKWFAARNPLATAIFVGMLILVLASPNVQSHRNFKRLW